MAELCQAEDQKGVALPNCFGFSETLRFWGYLFAQVPRHLTAALERRLHELRINQLISAKFGGLSYLPGPYVSWPHADCAMIAGNLGSLLTLCFDHTGVSLGSRMGSELFSRRGNHPKSTLRVGALRHAAPGIRKLRAG